MDLSKEEAWRQLATEVGGEFLKGDSEFSQIFGGKPDRVLIRVNQWTIALDTRELRGEYGSKTYTRIRAPYVNEDGFRFTVYRQTTFSRLAKLFGMQDIEVGYPDLDPHFIIKANDESKARELFANPIIRELVQSQPSIHLKVKRGGGWLPTSLLWGLYELYFEEESLITDVARLKSLCDLFGETLNQLYRIGSASEEDPNILF